MSRLPTPGQDSGTWGNILNDFLAVEHNSDGTLKIRTDGTLSGGAADATTSSKGIVQLAGDLSGTAASPTVANGAITDAKVAPGAAIAKSKLAALAIVDADVSAISEGKITNLTTDLAAKVPLTGGTMTGTLEVSRAATSDIGIQTKVTGDGTDRFAVVADGGMQWGPGNAGRDTNLYRAGSATLQTDGGFIAGGTLLGGRRVSVKSSDYSIASTDDIILASASGGAVVLTLPSTASNNRVFSIKKIDTSTNTVTVATTGGQTIDGSSSAVLRVPYVGVTVASDGTNWFIV